MADDRSDHALGSLRAFTLAEGILLLVLGVLALLFPVIASAWVTVVVALAFLVGGIVGWVNNLNRSRRLSKWHCFWRLVVSTLFLVTGAWIIQQFGAGLVPAAGQVAALAFAIGIVFLVEGVVASIVSLSHREMAGWGWGLANGIVTFILGLLIVTMKVGGLLSVLGILVGISFLFSGIDLLVFSAAFHGSERQT
ncbi:MAG: HdeD family acid-resistance protein [Vulcanococcus sp.]